LRSRGRLKLEVILGDAYLDGVTRPEFVLQDFLRQRVFDLLLNGPL
jgi:hypothetical protein